MKYCDTCHQTYPGDFQVCPRDNNPLRVVSELMEGMVIANKYSILEKIGAGGMASVYRARHLAFNEIRAIKVVNNRLMDDDGFIKRFKTEAVIARRLQHPNAVRVDDLDATEDGRPFIVMEYVHGQSLRRLIKEQGPMQAQRAVNIGIQVASALQAAHELGITHRDIKPDNILLTEKLDNADHVKVLDFGIAKVREGALDMDTSYTPTQTGMVVGTPAYISPEQARGRLGTQVDGRADVYSLGVVMYEMVTGELPFHAETSMAMILHHLHTPPVPPHKARPELHIPSPISLLLMKALEKDRESRFQSAEEMLAALRDPAEWASPGSFSSVAAKRAEAEEADELNATGIRGSENYELPVAAVNRAPQREPYPLSADTIPISGPSRGHTAEAAQPALEGPRFTTLERESWSKPRKAGIALALLVAVAIGTVIFARNNPSGVRRIEERATTVYGKAHASYAAWRNRSATTAPQPATTPQQTPPVPPTAPPPASSGTTPSATSEQPGGASAVQQGPTETAGSQSPTISPAAPAKAGAAPAQDAAKITSTPKSSSSLAPGAVAPSGSGGNAPAVKGEGRLSGAVFAAGSKPLADITIELENTALGFDQSVTTGTDGKYEFSQVPAGRGYILSAVKDGETQESRSGISIRGGNVRVAPIRIDEDAEVPSDNVRVYGKVYDAAGQPAASVVVKLENAKLKIDRGAVTNAEGSYSFTDVPPGANYQISIIKDNVAVDVRSSLTIPPAKVNPEQVLILYLKPR